ncbi:hypothetical protein GCM10023200_50840 [Actinomycetospora chlora]|uniref:Uncharacterized protein n=1 Tax=Actinomycetospora chlora TaxID=663608 RepID=A0ABP9CAT2_9PSEU
MTESAAGPADVPDAEVEALLARVGDRGFGTVPGRTPALLHEAYDRAQGVPRARLAVALARAWAYGGDPGRAAGFAAEALAAAEERPDPALLATALDAQLLVHWGPDDLAARRRITARLEDTVAHLTDVEARMSAHLWRLTVAWEDLDATAARRQVRALDLLAAESGADRARFFAAARRGALALVTGDLPTARSARREAVAAGEAAGEADTAAVDHELAAGIARQEGDLAALAREAAAFVEFGLAEGIGSIAAEGAAMWAEVGEHDRARHLLDELAGADLAGVPRDVDWLLVITSLASVAVAVGDRDVVAAAVERLGPYAGRGVVNAGVAFVGVVDDVLASAHRALGNDVAAESAADAAAAAYRRLGARWWLRGLGPAVPDPRTTPVPAPVRRHLWPGPDRVWWVGREGSLGALREARGLHHLRVLLARPGQGVPALELADAAAGHPGRGVAEGDLGPTLDRRALAAYRARLAEIDAERDEAAARADAGRVGRLDDEREAVLAEVRAATGLGGRPRRAGGAAERARVAVRKAIAGAVERVAAVDPATGRYLTDTVTTGAVCRYDPDPDRPGVWVLDDPTAR